MSILSCFCESFSSTFFTDAVSDVEGSLFFFLDFFVFIFSSKIGFPWISLSNSCIRASRLSDFFNLGLPSSETKISSSESDSDLSELLYLSNLLELSCDFSPSSSLLEYRTSFLVDTSSVSVSSGKVGIDIKFVFRTLLKCP